MVEGSSILRCASLFSRDQDNCLGVTLMAGPWGRNAGVQGKVPEKPLMPLRSRLRVWLESAMTENWRAHRDLEVLNDHRHVDGVR